MTRISRKGLTPNRKKQKKTGGPHGQKPPAYKSCLLFDGQPDGFTFILGLDDLLFELVEPFAAFEDFTYTLVATYEDTALGVLGGVARMDADALPLLVEFRATEQDGKPHLKLRTPRDHYGVAAFWDGRSAFYFVSTVGIVAPSGFEGVAEICVCLAWAILIHHLLTDVEVTYRVGLAFCYTF